MKRTLTALVLASASFVALAQATPVGLWRSFDEKTNEPTSEVRIAETDGVLNGKIEKRLLPNVKPDELCTECTDDRKVKPKLGLEIIRGAKKSAEADVWEGGKLMDPSTGRSWTLK